MFARLFLDGTPAEVRQQVHKLRDGQSIMDTVQGKAQRFAHRVGTVDRDKLDEYFSSVRELEQRLGDVRGLGAQAQAQGSTRSRRATSPTEPT